jgi:hypothetical protein
VVFLDQAAIAPDCARFLRRPSQPIKPRPVAKSGSAAGIGVAAKLENSNAGIPELRLTEWNTSLVRM